jgi:hypothetical protein
MGATKDVAPFGVIASGKRGERQVDVFWRSHCLRIVPPGPVAAANVGLALLPITQPGRDASK